MRETSLSWQKKLASGFSNAEDLLHFLELPQQHSHPLAEKQFATRIPLGFVQRMQKGNPNDPLLLQVLAVPEELDDVAGYTVDPLHEQQVNPLSGLLHKYHGRVLLTLTGTCAVNCRYCFRRHFPYQENNPGRKGWEAVCDYIAKDTTINEVILSGGDPFLAADSVLLQLIKKLNEIPHLTTLRIHTRVPVVLPERIDNDLLSVLGSSRLNTVVVLHSNHPQELDETVHEACIKLKSIGCYLLNQSVFLKGVNDDAEILALLSHKLFRIGVLPYYLHALDKVKGAAHFDMPLIEIQNIYKLLQSLLPGYLVPRLACEESGQLNKTLII